MGPEPVESTIKEVHLRQAGLTGKDLKNYLDKQFGLGKSDAEMIHNTYYIMASSVVSLVRINFCTMVALELFCFWVETNSTFLL